VLYRFVRSKMLICTVIEAALVSVETGLARNIFNNDSLDIFFVGGSNVEGTYFSTALNQRDDRTLIARTAIANFVGTATALFGNAGMFCLTEVGFVGFHDFASPTHRGKAAIAHRFAQAMHHKPSGFVGNFQRPMQLMGAKALFAGSQQMSRLKPFIQRNLAVLKNCPDRYTELFTTFGAGPKATASRLALNPIEAIRVSVAAMRA
jgi:hypothetical protein